MLDWREHRDAIEEYRRAAQWYEEKRPGWGDVFMDAVDAAVDSIRDPSVNWGFYRNQERSPQLYSRSVAGFPFKIVYLRSGREIYVLAYAHERKRPGYWSERLG
ncbi:hypothetical protein SAMN06309944_1330 [Micrococcales bacterium KH10]|nr:hypothetical protein SAMN06309944_1330 [Micrococcales bacterium KH10]